MIYGFCGIQRSGKSLSMTIEAVRLAQSTEQAIYCNYPIHQDIAGVPIIRFEKWKELKGVTNAIVLFDELGTSIDSRNFKSKEQMYFTHMYAQMGKLGITFMYTAQRMGLVDIRVRQTTDYRIDCRRMWPSHYIRQEWWDTQTDIHRLVRTSVFNGSKFYSLYDSFAVVNSDLNE